MSRKTGSYERSTLAGEGVAAFIPYPLPPRDPPLRLDSQLRAQLERAEQSLRMLNLAGALVPSIEWFVYAFVRKEAVLSAQIEGTQATLMDLFEVEASVDAPLNADLEEVVGYLKALNYAWHELARPEGLPLSMRLLSEAHVRLLMGTRGARKQPGEVRRSQNWIGGTRPGNAAFVPPPPHRLPELLSDFERAIHSESELPHLLRIGLLHVQFETLHPYLDGNGRLGRLLITLLLKHWRLLDQPLLYLSLYLKRHRQEYYRRLTLVREEGDWEGWLTFFLEGVESVANEAVSSAQQLHSIIFEKRQRLFDRPDATVLSFRLFEQLADHPVLTVSRVTEILDCSRPAAGKALKVLETAGILRPLASRQRQDRTLIFGDYLEHLRKGTEL